MWFLYDNVAPVAVALAVSAVTWLFGGARGDLLVPVVPWILALLVEVLVCFPQRHRGESTYAARARVWERLRSSPIVLISGGLFLLLAIPFLNTGLCPGCDADLIARGADPGPFFAFLPFCVDRIDHLHITLVIAMALVSAIVVRYSLTHAGKRLVLTLVVWNGVALALFGFVQAVLDAPGPFWTPIFGVERVPKGAFFSVFGYPNMAGDYFTLLFGISVALWHRRCAEQDKQERAMDPSERDAHRSRCNDRLLRRHYLLLPAFVFFFATIQTLSRAAMILVTVTAFVYFAHTLTAVMHQLSRSRRVYVGAWSIGLFLLLVILVSVFTPKDVQREIGTLDSLTVLDRVSGRGQYHGDVAMALWRDHPLFGCGGWGYKHLSVQKMEQMEIPRSKVQQTGGANVHNDYLQFLAEHGLIGFGALAAVAVFLLLPIVRQWRLLVRTVRFEKGERRRYPRPVQIFVLPAPVFFLMVACLATLIHAFGDCPLRASSILTLFYVVIAALPGFMPPPRSARAGS